MRTEDVKMTSGKRDEEKLEKNGPLHTGIKDQKKSLAPLWFWLANSHNTGLTGKKTNINKYGLGILHNIHNGNSQCWVYYLWLEFS